MASCKKRLDTLPDEDSDQEFKASLEVQLRIWEDKRKFFHHLLTMDLLPAEVPGDGDCGVWTVCALQSGQVIKTMLTTPERLLLMRKDGLEKGVWRQRFP